MQNKHKIFLIVFIIITIASISVTYYKYVIQEDYNTVTDEELFYESLEE